MAMKPYPLSQKDLARAYAITSELLDRAYAPADIRRRAERVLVKCDPESYRYAFWRFILILMVAGYAGPSQARGRKPVPATL
jgi:hypothetical protein